MAQKIRLGGDPADPSWIGGIVLLGLIAWHVRLPGNLAYHVDRFFGFNGEPSRAVIKQEVTRAADAFGLDRRVFHSLVRVESGGNPRAVSWAGARGLTQVMPYNAKRCGLAPHRLFDVTANARCGAKILRQELDRTGDLSHALTVYNCGKINCEDGKKYAQKVLSLAKKRG